MSLTLIKFPKDKLHLLSISHLREKFERDVELNKHFYDMKETIKIAHHISHFLLNKP